MAELILKVTSEEVTNKAAEIENQKSVMEGYMQEMLTKVTSLESAWDAQSGESYIEKYQVVQNNIQASLDTLERHVTNLKEAATRYETLENQQTQIVSNLGTDNIFTN